MQCSFSSPLHMISPPLSSPCHVHRISASPRMSHSYPSISCLSSSSFPLAHNVWTFQVPIFTISVVNFRCSVVPGTDFSTQPRFPSRGRGPWLSGRRPSRHLLVSLWFILSISYVLWFYGRGICTPRPTLLLYPGLGPAHLRRGVFYEAALVPTS